MGTPYGIGMTICAIMAMIAVKMLMKQRSLTGELLKLT